MNLTNLIPLEMLVGGVRIGFGLMFLVKLAYSFDALDLMWSHRRPGGDHLFRTLRVMLFVSTILFTLGLFTGPAALLTWLLYLILWRYASLYGMEDLSFHAISFYFVFAGAGAQLSIDTLLGTEIWGRFPEGSLLPELALAMILGILFLSAGVTKLPSKMWRSGLGAYYFFLMPNFRRWDTSLLTSHELPIRILNYAALLMEIALLPAMLLNAVPAGLFFWFMAAGFALTLSTVFILTWIGESLILGFLIVLWLLLHNGTAGLATLIAVEAAALPSGWMTILWSTVAVTLLAAFYVSVVPYYRWIAKVPLLRSIDPLIRWVSRNTWGLIPAIVFTEHHMEGPVVYRVWQKTGGVEEEVFRIFGEGSNPGPDRPFRPAFYEVTSYKVAEACMELDQWGEVKSEPRLAFIYRLAELIARKTEKKQGHYPDSLTFRMRQIIPPSGFAGSVQPHLEKPWRDAFDVVLEQGRAVEIRSNGHKILDGPTGRDLNRISFAFNPRQP